MACHMILGTCVHIDIPRYTIIPNQAIFWTSTLSSSNKARRNITSQRKTATPYIVLPISDLIHWHLVIQGNSQPTNNSKKEIYILSIMINLTNKSLIQNNLNTLTHFSPLIVKNIDESYPYHTYIFQSSR